MKIISIFICSVLLLSFVFSPASALETTHEETYVEFIFEDDISEEIKAKIEAHLLGEHENLNSRGILCNIFGHDLVSSNTTQITHKAKSTAPRCLKEVYKVEVCEDCDYTKSTLISSSYINCCS